METQTIKPQGKGLAIAGFVIALIGLLFYFIIAAAVTVQAALGGGYGLGIFWLVLCLGATVMCILSMMKLGKTGGKRGLAIAGMILGLIATVLSVLLVIGIGKMHEVATQYGDQFQQEMQKSMDEAKGE
jgi:hypothetical protein